MLPEHPTSYPKFVADQLLTAENLNDLFGYLDMQERGTRINLVGIGIVCGLELTMNAAGNEIVIGKGCGVTSEGYLVRWNETRFANYKPYNAARELVYAPFYANGAQRFPIDELKANASEEGIVPLNAGYLSDKAVVMFVELLRTENKNCDPESCDDKGGNINYTLRPLLLRKSDAAGLIGGLAAGTGFQQGWWQLPALKMPRHHLPAGDVYDSGDVFEGFLKTLSPAFIKSLQTSLSGAWNRLRPLLNDLYPTDPFASLSSDFAFLGNGQLTAQQLLYTQYIYDLFSDLIAAYEELRQTGNRLLTLCCPDESLFPRHLLLGTAASTSSGVNPELRHGFFQSPAMSRHGSMTQDVRMLFRRLTLLLEHFNPDAGTAAGNFSGFRAGIDLRIRRREAPIRITPSRLGPEPLSAKAIPYYYDVASGTDKLFQNWDPGRRPDGSARAILSYHNALYNTGSQAVQEALRPLSFDLEDYNFLRIEGHVGRRYTDALAQINTLRDSNRLPFDVVALSADIRSLRERLALIANSTNNGNLRTLADTDMPLNCHFQDLEALYDTLAQGLLCQLTKEMKYYYELPRPQEATMPDKVPAVPLLVRMDPTFRFRSGSLGERFEALWKSLAKQPYITPDQFFGSSFSSSLLIKQSRLASNAFIPFLALMYYIERLSEILTTTLVSFNIVSFQRRYTDLMTVARRIRDMLELDADTDATGSPDLEGFAVREDLIDRLDALLYACKDAQFMALYNDYKVRWVYLSMLRTFGYYLRMHPGIQHKAGVPMGGTFIMVYHERSRLKRGNTNIFTRATAAADAARTRAADASAENRTAPPDARDTEQDPDVTGAVDDALKARAAEGTEPAAGKAAAPGTAAATIRQLNTAKLKTTLSARQLEIIDRLFYKDLITKHSLDELTAELPDQVVIADFFLPYMCSSDCPPVYFIVNETKDETDPTVSMRQTEFCNADKTDYPVAVNPAGGAIRGEGTRDDNGSIVFNPSAVSIPEDSLNKVVTISYTVDGETSTASVTVFAKPVAGFEVQPATAYNVLSVRSTSTRAASLSWDFGDGTTGSGASTFHTYTQDGTFTVTLTATNGVCSDKHSETITIARASIALEGSDFCSADKTAYPVSVTPAGGKPGGDGVESKDGQVIFRPSLVSFGKGVAVREVALTYATAGQLAQTSVRVFQTPVAAFGVSDSAAAGNVKLFSSQTAFQASHLWDFGDGGSSQEANPAHQYLRPGTYVVTHTVTNGPCRDSATQTVSMQAASVSLSPGKFCSIDRNSYPITVAPAGGQASGEGVRMVDNAFSFRPAVVSIPETAASTPVVITYNVNGVSAQTQVEVFRTPSAVFSVTPGTGSPNERRFTTSNAFKAELFWDFGDGGTSTDPNPTHIYKSNGSFTVSLRASNGPCNAEYSEDVVIGERQAKSCGPLADILTTFAGLGIADPDRYKTFRGLYKPQAAVQTYFNTLNQIAASPVDDQVKHFSKTKVGSLLAGWFESLQPLVLESDVREIALRLWAVLADLAAYVMCIQNDDYEKSEVNLQSLFDALARYYKAWGAVIGKWSAAERAVVAEIRNSLNAEISRIKANGEDNVKANYLADLNALVTLFESGFKK